MKVHVFDTYVTIKDREGHPDMDDTLLEKLDEMLTTYGVPHAFTLPHEKTMEDCPEATLEVAYDSSDDMIARKLLLKLPMILLMILWGDRIFEKCGIRRDEEGDGGKTLEIRGKRRLSARDGGANYQQS